MVAVPSLVSEEREGCVWMLMEVGRAWRTEKEGGKKGLEERGDWTYTWAGKSRIPANSERKGALDARWAGSDGLLHTVMEKRFGLLTRMMARMGMEPSAGRGVTIWISTTFW